jgi:UDP-N-acetylmuramoyl-tripeptide--D-alanyl-D-alanine ligase
MNTEEKLFEILKKCKFKVSKDTREDLNGRVYFALKGDKFDGNMFVHEAIKKGAIAAVTDNPKNTGQNVYFVPNVLITLQDLAIRYRKLFKIPIIVIGGSNGKTTSKELVRDVLKNKYKVHATIGSLNNHFGVPLSILSMDKKTEIAVFEIGANHPKEHTKLLNIISPTHVIVTNNGMDHLEGFGSPRGSRKANKEIYDWALVNNAIVFVNKNHKDLMADSNKNIRITYPKFSIKDTNENPLTVVFKKKKFKTKLFGNYNLENIKLATSVGKNFGVDIESTIKAIRKYKPAAKRSQFIKKNNINFVVDCYNANPTSMLLALESFVNSTKEFRGVILGDMLELGKYSDSEHEKIVKYVLKQKFDCIIFVGKNFKKALADTKETCRWFPDSNSAKLWFSKQKFDNFTFLLKGSRGIKIEKILEL